MHPTIHVLAMVFAVAGLTACNEKPPRSDPERGHAYNQSPQSPLYERTRNQGESDRFGN